MQENTTAVAGVPFIDFGMMLRINELLNIMT
jgi:hypothetical protein